MKQAILIPMLRCVTPSEEYNDFYVAKIDLQLEEVLLYWPLDLGPDAVREGELKVFDRINKEFPYMDKLFLEVKK